MVHEFYNEGGILGLYYVDYQDLSTETNLFTPTNTDDEIKRQKKHILQHNFLTYVEYLREISLATQQQEEAMKKMNSAASYFSDNPRVSLGDMSNMMLKLKERMDMLHEAVKNDNESEDTGRWFFMKELIVSFCETNINGC